MLIIRTALIMARLFYEAERLANRRPAAAGRIRLHAERLPGSIWVLHRGAAILLTNFLSGIDKNKLL